MDELKKCLRNAYRFDKNGWIQLHIEGDPYHRGYQHGFLLAKEIEIILKAIKHFTLFNTGKEFTFFVETADKMFTPHIDQEFIEEIHGIADGASAAGVTTSFAEILAWNGYTELINYWWPFLKKKSEHHAHEKEHCSAFIATGDATKSKEIVIAHNSWDNFILGQHLNIILDIIPSEGYRIFMQSSPGYIDSFSDFFITGAGIVGTETTIAGFNQFNEKEAPEFFRARKAMQYGGDIDTWVELMQKHNNGGYANSWLLGDIKTNEIARFEQGLEYSSISKTKNGYFTGFNAATDPRIRNLECGYSGYLDVRHTGARRIRWEQLMIENYGKIDTKTATVLLADHYDVYLDQENHPCMRTICGHSDEDPCQFTGLSGAAPFSPSGAFDGKVTSSIFAKDLCFWGRFGRACGQPFNAEEFLEKHPQWDWQRGYLIDRPTQPWTLFKA
jgi:Phospholipase B